MTTTSSQQGQATTLAVMMLTGLAAQLGAPTRRVAAMLTTLAFAAAAAALVGAASVAFPTLPSSFGVGWGLGAIAWAIALGAVSTVGSRPSAATASRNSAGGLR